MWDADAVAALRAAGVNAQTHVIWADSSNPIYRGELETPKRDKKEAPAMAGALSLGRKRPRRARQWIARFNRRRNYAYGGLDYTLE
jgi:hypothetical protein